MTEKTQKKQRQSGVGTGTTSLLVIFTVLCMATLGLLSYSTTATEERLGKRSLKSAQDLTFAQGEAEKKLSEIDNILLLTEQENEKDARQYYKKVKQALENLGCEIEDQSNTVSFVIEINEQSHLVTIFEIMPPGSLRRYEVRSQKSELTMEWAPEENTNVWLG